MASAMSGRRSSTTWSLTPPQAGHGGPTERRERPDRQAGCIAVHPAKGVACHPRLSTACPGDAPLPRPMSIVIVEGQTEILYVYGGALPVTLYSQGWLGVGTLITAAPSGLNVIAVRPSAYARCVNGLERWLMKALLPPACPIKQLIIADTPERSGFVIVTAGSVHGSQAVMIIADKGHVVGSNSLPRPISGKSQLESSPAAECVVVML